MNTPASWDDEVETEATHHAPQGVLDVDCVVNEKTSITCVGVPVFNREKPIHGTKEARESGLKLLAGMCNDVSPLNCRYPQDKDTGKDDPYFRVAPYYSSLSGGRNPFVIIKPQELTAKVTRAFGCVPLVREVRIFVLGSDNVQRRVTQEELEKMDIPVKTVPNLYKRAISVANGSRSSDVPPVNLTPVFERQHKLEQDMAAVQTDVKTALSMLPALAEQLAALKDLMSATPATAAASSTDNSTADQAADEEEDAVVPPSSHRRVRRRL